jgi:hypothetical protein
VRTLAYLTTDEVNEEIALRMAAMYDANLVPLDPRDKDTEYDAVLYDFDFLPAESRRKVLSDLLSAASKRPAALHSFNLDDRLRHDLQCKGVDVFSKLGPECLRKLVKMKRR